MIMYWNLMISHMLMEVTSPMTREAALMAVLVLVQYMVDLLNIYINHHILLNREIPPIALEVHCRHHPIILITIIWGMVTWQMKV